MSEVTCESCSIIFHKVPSEILKSKSGKHFCSLSCSTSYWNKSTPKRKKVVSFCTSCEKPLPCKTKNKNALCLTCYQENSKKHKGIPSPKVIKTKCDEVRTRRYTDQDIIENSKQVRSIAQLLISLGLKPRGGNYYNIKKHLQRLNVDTSHWTGQAWNKGQQLLDWSQYTKSSQLKPHLIKEKGHCCEVCDMDTWMGNIIPLEVHHLNGIRTDNRYENLQLLCHNCHALTYNFRGKKSTAY